MHPKVNVYRLGRMSYTKALEIQHSLFRDLKSKIADTDQNLELGSRRKPELLEDSRKSNKFDLKSNRTRLSSITNSLLIVEHDPVYTIGIRTKEYDENYIRNLKEKLANNNLTADFVKSSRGGLVTFHGPGQLVVYPILYLGEFATVIRGKSIREYVRLLEKTVVDTLTRVGLRGAHTVKEYPGVWLADGDRKIGFVGITCKRHVTMHGIAINCNCDLSWFDHIISCGIEDKTITSIQHELSSFQNEHDNQLLRRTETQVGQQIYNNSTQVTTTSYPFISSVPSSGSDTDNAGIARISDLFCLSFAQNFSCNLKDEVLHFHDT